ncbi:MULTISPECIES: helix-turn-helix transcriptional regulator [unclassified Bradyrhizobium]|uniref:helix-turn-helix domain-containing protein n=1 Tax=unclassified Bradyrhizobium TaxID=2631580 RepID=UPI002916ED5D|nr:MULTISPECIES: helix-turn-helix transcriptional regulator [unclassified Bradyrhizobium]
MPKSASIKKPRSTTETDAKIGRRIRMRRLELGMSQTDLANAVGVTFQQIQKYEKGINGIRGSRLAAIAAALQVDLPFLFAAKDAAPDDTVVDKFITSPEGVRIAKAFAQIPESTRATIVKLAEALANENWGLQ